MSHSLAPVFSEELSWAGLRHMEINPCHSRAVLGQACPHAVSAVHLLVPARPGSPAGLVTLQCTPLVLFLPALWTSPLP